MQGSRTGTWGALLALVGIGLVLYTHWLVFFWVPTEATQGIVQRIFYVRKGTSYVPSVQYQRMTAVGAGVRYWDGVTPTEGRRRLEAALAAIHADE